MSCELLYNNPGRPANFSIFVGKSRINQNKKEPLQTINRIIYFFCHEKVPKHFLPKKLEFIVHFCKYFSGNTYN